MNIYQKIAEVMKAVKYLQKDGKIDFKTKDGKTAYYKTVTEEAVTSLIRPELIKQGIVIVPVKQEHQKVGTLTTVDVAYRIQNIDDPEDFIEVMSSGTGADIQDKGVGKAMTYAYKYMLLRTFAIPTGDDPDKMSNEELERKEKEEALKHPCEDCGQIIKPFKNKNGKTMTVDEIEVLTINEYGRPLCLDCAKKATEAAKKDNGEAQ